MWATKLSVITHKTVDCSRKLVPLTSLYRGAHSTVPGRTGLLAIKAGMLAEFDSWGVRQVLTVLLVDECEVTQIKQADTDGYTALQVGVSQAKIKNVTKPLRHHFAKAGVEPKRNLQEFRIVPEAIVPTGTRLFAQHFVPGQLVDVCGISKGKGFQGAMKRHGFAGMRATHGVSKTHRALGSTGQCQDPGRVFKGKKMAGRMGGDRVTMQNLQVYKIDADRNLVYVKGHVPGNNGGFIRITDAVKGPNFPSPPPFPTFFAKEGEETVKGELYADASSADPLAPVDGE